MRRNKIHLDLPTCPCATCKKEFPPARKGQRFCSARCRWTFHNGRLTRGLSLLAEQERAQTTATAEAS